MTKKAVKRFKVNMILQNKHYPIRQLIILERRGHVMDMMLFYCYDTLHDSFEIFYEDSLRNNYNVLYEP